MVLLRVQTDPILMLCVGKGNPQLVKRIPQWNQALPHHAIAFQRLYSDISVGVFDVHSLFLSVLAHPPAFGFRNSYSICDGNQCIWADVVHSTFAMHKIIATDMLKFLADPNATNITVPNSTLTPSRGRRKSTPSCSIFMVTLLLACGFAG
jgi:phospholipase/lecithinase/hemolysin